MVRIFFCIQSSLLSILYNVHVQSGRTNADLCIDGTCADPENFLGGGGVQRGLTENFNIAKINNLAIPGDTVYKAVHS